MTRRQYDKRVLGVMIKIYCRSKHRSEDLCEECAQLFDYACQRVDKCPLGELKTSCKKCQIHCYSHHRRDQVRTIMRYAAPRVLFLHPIIAIRHLISI